MIIADDHEIARAGIRNALIESLEISIVGEVSDGASLIEMLQSTPADFLIMDVSMPDFEPLTAIRLIRKRHPDLLILVVSAYDDDMYVQGLLGAGVNGYHLKDQPLSDLRLAVERILAGERWISSRLIRKLLTPETNTSKIELSARQIDIARGLASGLSNRELADELMLSVKTIENHLTRLYRQLYVNSRLEAANFIHDHPEILAQSGRSVAQEPVELVYPASNQASIILVDDNKRYRKQLAGLIGRFYPDLLIYEAGNWQELHSIIDYVIPDIAFIDVVLGDEDGIRVTWRLKQQAPTVHVILISAYPDREFHRRGVESGAVAFVDKKNLDSATIKQMLDDILVD